MFEVIRFHLWKISLFLYLRIFHLFIISMETYNGELYANPKKIVTKIKNEFRVIDRVELDFEPNCPDILGARGKRKKMGLNFCRTCILKIVVFIVPNIEKV